MAQQRDTEQYRPEHVYAKRRSSGAGMGIVAILVSLLFIVGPLAAPVQIPVMSQVILVGFGVFLLLVGGIVVIVTRLYRKASADEAFVRTGKGGAQAVVDGGCIVIPVLHDVMPVTLKTLKLKVTRTGLDALITEDKLRADVHAEFFIRVEKDERDVLSAAATLGEKAVNPQLIEDTVMEKLVNALRTVGTTKRLFELNSDLAGFASSVRNIVMADLKHNGLTLESVTISKLDQTPMDPHNAATNVFDAEGAKRFAEITNDALVKKTEIENKAKQDIATNNALAAKAVATQEVTRETAEANKARDVRSAKATADREAAETEATQQRLAGVAKADAEKDVQVANVKKDEAVQVAGVDREKAVQVAQTQQQKAVKTAEVDRDRTIEIANRDRQIAVQEKEKDLAAATAARNEAEAEAEKKRQQVKTVEVTATAEREKEKTVIGQKAQAETDRIKRNTEADIAAYAVTAQAQAEKTAADNQASAKVVLATAEKDALTFKAAGDQAVGMVPVNVQREQVAVERASLANQQEFEKIASGLKVKLAEIEASKEVQVALAGAIATGLSQAKLTLWGTPEQAEKMMASFLKGQQFSTMVSGLLTSSGDSSGIASLANVVLGAVEKATGLRLDAAKVNEVLAAVSDGKAGAGA